MKNNSTFINSLLRYQIINNYVPHLLMLTWIIIQTSLWFKGGVIYAGDQGFIVYPGSSNSFYVQPLLYGIQNIYPFLAGPSSAFAGLWYWIIVIIFNFLPFKFSEQLLIIFLLYVGAIYTFKLIYDILVSSKGSPLHMKYKVILALTVAITYTSNYGLWFANSSGAGQSILTIYFIYSLLPATIYYIRKIFTLTSFRREMKSLLRFYLILGLLFMILGNIASIYNFLEVFGIILIVSISYLFISRKKVNIINTIGVPSLFLAVNYFLITPLLPVVHSTVNNEEFLKISYQYFVGNSRPFFLVFSGIYNFFTPFWILLLSLMVVSISFFLIISSKKINKEILLWPILYLLILTFYAGIGTPFGPIYSYLFLHFRFFVEFRTLVIAFAWLQGFVYSLLLSFASYFISLRLEGLRSRSHYALLAKNVVPYIYLSLVVLSLLPIVQGTGFNPVYVPNGLVKTSELINNQPGNFYVLALPPSGLWYQSKYYHGVNLLTHFLSKPVIVGGEYDIINYNLRLIYNNIVNLLQQDNITKSNLMLLFNLLYILNIKYIIVQGDAVNYNISKALHVLNEYQKVGLVQFIANYSPYYIYETTFNTSPFMGTNMNISELENTTFLERYNLTSFLVPLKYQEINPSKYIVYNVSGFKTLIFLYTYSPYFITIPKLPHGQILYMNYYNLTSNVTNSVITVYNSYYSINLEQITHHLSIFVIILILLLSTYLFELRSKVRFR